MFSATINTIKMITIMITIVAVVIIAEGHELSQEEIDSATSSMPYVHLVEHEVSLAHSSVHRISFGKVLEQCNQFTKPVYKVTWQGHSNAITLHQTKDGVEIGEQINGADTILINDNGYVMIKATETTSEDIIGIAFVVEESQPASDGAVHKEECFYLLSVYLPCNLNPDINSMQFMVQATVEPNENEEHGNLLIELNVPYLPSGKAYFLDFVSFEDYDHFGDKMRNQLRKDGASRFINTDNSANNNNNINSHNNNNNNYKKVEEGDDDESFVLWINSETIRLPKTTCTNRMAFYKEELDWPELWKAAPHSGFPGALSSFAAYSFSQHWSVSSSSCSTLKYNLNVPFSTLYDKCNEIATAYPTYQQSQSKLYQDNTDGTGSTDATSEVEGSIKRANAIRKTVDQLPNGDVITKYSGEVLISIIKAVDIADESKGVKVKSITQVPFKVTYIKKKHNNNNNDNNIANVAHDNNNNNNVHSNGDIIYLRKGTPNLLTSLTLEQNGIALKKVDNYGVRYATYNIKHSTKPLYAFFDVQSRYANEIFSMKSIDFWICYSNKEDGISNHNAEGCLDPSIPSSNKIQLIYENEAIDNYITKDFKAQLLLTESSKHGSIHSNKQRIGAAFYPVDFRNSNESPTEQLYYAVHAEIHVEYEINTDANYNTVERRTERLSHVEFPIKFVNHHKATASKIESATNVINKFNEQQQQHHSTSIFHMLTTTTISNAILLFIAIIIACTIIIVIVLSKRERVALPQ